jgi:hypothetical protein
MNTTDLQIRRSTIRSIRWECIGLLPALAQPVSGKPSLGTH